MVVRNDTFWVDHEEFLKDQGYSLRPFGHATSGIREDMGNGVPSGHVKVRQRCFELLYLWLTVHIEKKLNGCNL